MVTAVAEDPSVAVISTQSFCVSASAGLSKLGALTKVRAPVEESIESGLVCTISN